MPAATRAVATAVLIGAGTGLRSQMGMAATVLGPHPSPLPALLGRPGARRAAVVLAAGELVVDKLPSAPARTQAAGLAARLTLGALAAGLTAVAAGARPEVPALVGAGTALGAAHLGLRARLAAARRLPPVVAGLAEDVVAAALSGAGVALAARR